MQGIANILINFIMKQSTKEFIVYSLPFIHNFKEATNKTFDQLFFRILDYELWFFVIKIKKVNIKSADNYMV